MKIRLIFFYVMIVALSLLNKVLGQSSSDFVDVGESMKEYIKENHIDQIEDMVHQFANSKVFLEFLLEQGHHIDVENLDLKKRDIRVGDDLDVYVKHFSEHQNFTMILMPVDFYSLLIYDTLLFSVLEVSDQWLLDKYRYHELDNPEVKERVMSVENHDRLAKHMYEQASTAEGIGISEVSIELKEGYISSNTVHMHVSELSKGEKKDFRKSWNLMKKVFAHDVNLNVEMNIYVFGTDDMKIHYTDRGVDKEYKINPRNIFTRHHFRNN